MWAFGTSPYGLHLETSELWSLTVGEYNALRKVWEDHMRSFSPHGSEIFGRKPANKPSKSWQEQRAIFGQFLGSTVKKVDPVN